MSRIKKIFVYLVIGLFLISAIPAKEGVTESRTAQRAEEKAESKTVQKCEDSDNGLDYYTKGQVNIMPVCEVGKPCIQGFKVFTDECYEGILKEYYCQSNGEEGVKEIKCPVGCQDGACVKETGCVGEGGKIVAIPDAKKCCEGLKAVYIATESSSKMFENGCAVAAGAMICSNCGNGVCERWENRCNCKEDCEATPICGNGICEEGEKEVLCVDYMDRAGKCEMVCPQDCKIQTGTCQQVCKNIGTRSEGWYNSCTGELIKWDKCGGGTGSGAKRREDMGSKATSCIEDMLKKLPEADKDEVAKKCALRALTSAEPVVRAERIKELKQEDFREFQKEQLQIAADKCKEKNLSSELCEKKLEKRAELIDKLKEKDIERLKKIEERKTEKLKELEEMRSDPSLAEYKKELAFKARAIREEKLKEAKEGYLNARERYKEAREKYDTAKDKFDETKQKLKECEGKETEECNNLREEAEENAKEFLLKAADNILEHLNKVKANVQANEELTESEASEIIAEIDGMIKEIEEARLAVENAKTKEEIEEGAKTIKKTWLIIRKRLIVHTGRIVNARIGGIIVKIKHLEVKLERILARMEEKGIDTSKIQPLVDEFNAKVKEAKDNYENALNKFKEAKDAKDVETAHKLAVEGNRLMKASHKALQDAQQLLRKIVAGIKELGGGEELTASEDMAEEEASL